MIRYGLGQDDKFKGTGVFSFIEFDRKKADSDNDDESIPTIVAPPASKRSSAKASDADDA